MKLFNCKVCEEKNARIKDLLTEVAYLRELAAPSRLTVQIPTVHAEADKIITNTDDQESIEISVDNNNELFFIDNEASQILGGTY